MSTLAGELVVTTAAEQLTRVIDALDARSVDLDLSGVEEIDCAGVQLLALAWKDARRLAMPFRVTAASSAVHDALGLLGMHVDAAGDLVADQVLEREVSAS